MSLRIYFGIISIVLVTIPYGCGQMFNGGPVLSLSDFGYQAVVHIIVNNEIVKFCGGTILSAFHVLTTASCFANAPNKFYDIQVRVGSINVLNAGDLYNVSKVERHPEYYSYISTHNLAIIFISNGIQFMQSKEVDIDGLDYIKHINSILLGHRFISGGDKVVLSGYSLKSKLTNSRDLYSMHTLTMSYFPCLDFFRDSNLSVELIDDEILCVQNNPAAGYCDILDGSSIVLDDKLIGIFLYNGGDCNDEKAPLLVTRIANNLLWLQSTIKGLKFKDIVEKCSAT